MININTGKLYNDADRLVKALANNGFKVYDSTIEIENDNLTISKLDVNFKLEKGDIVCRNGHVHIYIGNDGTDNFGCGKVNRYYPVNYSFSIEEIDNQYKVRMDKENSVEYYDRIYRYVGGN